MSKMQAKYMGYRAEDNVTSYAKYYNENILPIPSQVAKNVEKSPYPAGSLAAIKNVSYLLSEDYQEIETGFTLEKDGSAHVAVLTDMPNILPKMWDWWFAWHGSHDNRYKLWHPKSHKSAKWKDGKTDVLEYVGRTSIIEEYIGKRLEKGAIRFISPSELGLKNTEKEVFICARVGYPHLPVDFGWLVHQIRVTEKGAEMRSRFWMGGKYIQVRGNAFFSPFLSGILQKMISVPKQQVADLLTHCSEEMQHLAAILPTIYKEQNINK